MSGPLPVSALWGVAGGLALLLLLVALYCFRPGWTGAHRIVGPGGRLGYTRNPSLLRVVMSRSGLTFARCVHCNTDQGDRPVARSPWWWCHEWFHVEHLELWRYLRSARYRLEHEARASNFAWDHHEEPAYVAMAVLGYRALYNQLPGPDVILKWALLEEPE